MLEYYLSNFEYTAKEYERVTTEYDCEDDISDVLRSVEAAIFDETPLSWYIENIYDIQILQMIGVLEYTLIYDTVKIKTLNSVIDDINYSNTIKNPCIIKNGDMTIIIEEATYETL